MNSIKLVVTSYFLFLILGVYSQTVGISDVDRTPDNNAVLDIYSTTKGMILPRVSDSTSITGPTKGYLAYFTTTESIWFYDSQKWCELTSAQKDINISDSIYLGSPNNHLSIDDSGNVFLRGEATTFDDLQVPVLTTVKGADPPDDLTVLGKFKVYGFKTNKSNEIFFTVQLPHNYKEGSSLYPHVHWMPTNTNTGTVTWKLEYSWANNDGTFSSTTTTVGGTSNASGTENKHQITPLGTISGSGKKISSMIVCRLYRDGTADSYDTDAALLEFDFHYEVDSFGSRQEYIK